MRNTVAFALTLVISGFISCGFDSGLKQALRLAGDNRPELEKVLSHYSDDPLKLAAAEFLIENMPAHYSYLHAPHILAYYDEVDSVSSRLKGMPREYMDSAYSAVSQKCCGRRLQYVSDVKIMDADYLTEHIDRAFEVWQHGEWATHLSFDDFCEYLLPYKVAELQELDDWRVYMYDSCRGELDKLPLGDPAKHSPLHACLTVSDKMREELQPLISFNNAAMSVRRMRSLARKHIGTCEDYSVLALGVMRPKGIPVAIDFIHQWPFQSLNHTWCVMLDNTGRNVVFDASSSGSGKTSLPSPLGKVYRRTYAINREIAAIFRKDKHVSQTFRNVCMKDVSGEYMVTDDVEVSLTDVPKESHYAYLAVFDNREWIPVHYGKITRGKATFTDMGRGVAYLPVCWSENGLTPVGNPFILILAGEVRPLEADETQRQTIRVLRKYWASQDAVWAAGRAQYGRIQASDFEDFREVCDVFTIEDIPRCGRRDTAGHLTPVSLLAVFRLLAHPLQYSGAEFLPGR